MSTTTTYTGVRIADMPDLGTLTDTSSLVGEHAGSGRFGATAIRDYILAGNNTFTGLQTIDPPGTLNGDATHKALTITVDGAGVTPTPGGHFALIHIESDTVAAGVALDPAFITGFDVFHQMGGATLTGGRLAIAGQISLESPTSPSNTNRNYVGVFGQTTAHTADCGTPGAEAGAFFGLNGDTVLLSGATNVSNASAAEFKHVRVPAPDRASEHKTGIQDRQKPLDARAYGSTTDAAISDISLRVASASTLGILSG